MRKQIAAANWKMNMTYQQGEKLIDEIINAKIELGNNQQVIFAVPYPYLIMGASEVADENGYSIAAQNCSDKKNGAYTGEISAEMLHSVGIKYCIVGHSERREYFLESNHVIAEKLNHCFANYIRPIFCCGEPLHIRENEEQNAYVQKQLEESLFHLDIESIKNLIVAYEPIWAIGTGRTATSDQAQEMHQHLRSVIAGKFGQSIADDISILYGGSVKGSNAGDIFSKPDVDGGLVGGASLVAQEFIQITKALKK